MHSLNLLLLSHSCLLCLLVCFLNRAQGGGRASGLTGQMVHALFERALTLNAFDTPTLEKEAEVVVAGRIENMYVSSFCDA